MACDVAVTWSMLYIQFDAPVSSEHVELRVEIESLSVSLL